MQTVAILVLKSGDWAVHPIKARFPVLAYGRSGSRLAACGTASLENKVFLASMQPLGSWGSFLSGACPGTPATGQCSPTQHENPEHLIKKTACATVSDFAPQYLVPGLLQEAVGRGAQAWQN